MRNTRGGAIAATVCGLLLAGIGAPAARAGLISETIGGTPLIYDTTTGAWWTENADVSNQTFTYQGAVAWAAGLTLAGLSWELPTAADFTSLYTGLAPYGPPGATSGKIGAQVPFGPGEYADNVQEYYWTDTVNVDFNFSYGYAGTPLTDSLAAWAIRAPEPSTAWLLLAGAPAALRLRRRKA